VADAVSQFLGITYARHVRADAISLDVRAAPAG
jgi:hypothetical protein